MSEVLQLPVIDLSSEDRLSTAKSIRQACLDLGFFYLVNHGVEEELIKKVFEHSNKFFALPVEEKVNFAVKNHRGYTGLFYEKLDTSLNAAIEDMPSWRSTMEAYYKKVLSAHSDYGTVTLLLTDGVPGVQVFREKSEQQKVWEDVPSISGYIRKLRVLSTCEVPSASLCISTDLNRAFIVNIGDMMERSTMHRVMPTRQEGYQVAFFLEPNKDCIVECLESCCSESCFPRFPPIRSSDYLEERFRLAATASTENHWINI